MNRNGVYDPGVDRKSIQKLAPAPTGAGTPVTTDSQDLSNTGVQDSSQTTTLNSAGSNTVESDNGVVTDTKTTPPAYGGWMTTTSNPDGTKTVDTYADGLLVKEQHLGTDGSTDIVGPTTYVYNGLRELTSKTDYTGTTNYSYFQDGTQSGVQTPGHSAQTVNAIDPATNAATTTTRPDSNQIQTPQNLLGQATAQTGAGLLSANFGYEDTTGAQTGQLNSLTTFQGTTTLNAGTLTGSGAATTGWSYDPNTGLLKSKTYADGTQDKYQYNSARQLINVIEPGLAGSSFGYDTAGEQTSSSYTDSITGTVSSNVQPDDLGRPAVVSSTDNGVSTTEVNLFNQSGQPYQTIFASSLAQVQYNYYPTTSFGSTGSPLALSTLSIQSLSGSTLASNTYTYGPVDKRLQTISLPGTNPVTIAYSYFGDTSQTSKPDASNQVQSVNVTSPGNPGLTLTYLRDTSSGGNEGRLIEAESSANGGTFSAVAAGSPAFNQQDQLTEQTISQPAIGTIASQSDMWSYSYDAGHADALTGATDSNNHGSSTTYAYNYDGVGNRTGTALGTANSVNEYSSITYNSRHDETNDGTFAYGWDALDRLISVTPNHPAAGSQQEQMGYDSQGRLLWQELYNWNTTTNSWQYASTRNHVYDGANLVGVTDASGNLLQSFIWGPTGLIAETDYPADPNNPQPWAGPTTDIVVEDLSSSVRELANARTGSIDAEYYYGPFGENYTSSGLYANVFAFGFQQMMRDPVSGKWYDKARWYDASQGRFMTPDPSGEQSGVALFPLDGNDPVNKLDPSGLDFVLNSPDLGNGGSGIGAQLQLFAPADIQFSQPVQIGWVYTATGVYNAQPSIYTGKATSLEERLFTKTSPGLSTPGHKYAGLIRDVETNISVRPIYGDATPKVGETPGEAVNRAQRVQEQVQMDINGWSSDPNARVGPNGEVVLNTDPALSPAKQAAYQELYNTSMGDSVVAKEVGAALDRTVLAELDKNVGSPAPSSPELLGGDTVGVNGALALLQLADMFASVYQDARLGPYAMAPYKEVDSGGVFSISYGYDYNWTGWRSNKKWLKEYESGPNAGQKVSITKEQYDQYKAQMQLDWGYIDWKGDFQPGVFQQELPEIKPPSAVEKAQQSFGLPQG
jgi:RHS repeat-associated protein